MNKAMLSAAITLIVIETVAYFLTASLSRFTWNNFGSAQFICGFFASIIAIILSFIPRTNQISKGVFLAIGIVLLIGLAVCSNNKSL